MKISLTETTDHARRSGPRSTIAATVVWISDQPLQIGASYLIKRGSMYLSARIINVVGVLAPEIREWRHGNTLALHQWGLIEIAVAGEFGADEQSLPKAILVLDPATNRSVAAGTLGHFSPT